MRRLYWWAIPGMAYIFFVLFETNKKVFSENTKALDLVQYHCALAPFASKGAVDAFGSLWVRGLHFAVHKLFH
jgi:hypothetical protein